MRGVRRRTARLVALELAPAGSPSRREWLCGFLATAAGARAMAAPLLVSRTAAPPAEPFPKQVTILVPGPEDGRMDGWAGRLGSAVCRAFPPGTACRRAAIGGADGVTAANRFQARGVPDGATVLLVPGEATLAWLTGDSRARFDAADWTAVMTGMTSGVLASRVPAAALRPGARLRVAVAAPTGPDLAALLALDLIGIDPLAVVDTNGPEAVAWALRRGMVDAVLLVGPDGPANLARLKAAGAEPLFTLGWPAGQGVQRDPMLPAVPTAPELAARLRGAVLAGPLAAAWRAAAAAAQMDFALVLPAMTPAALIASWRLAGDSARHDLDGQIAGVRLLSGTAACEAMTALAPGPAAVLELRRWLATRFNWSPS
jgi:hypothetical protein